MPGASVVADALLAVGFEGDQLVAGDTFTRRTNNNKETEFLAWNKCLAGERVSFDQIEPVR